MIPKTINDSEIHKGQLKDTLTKVTFRC